MRIGFQVKKETMFLSKINGQHLELSLCHEVPYPYQGAFLKPSSKASNCPSMMNSLSIGLKKTLISSFLSYLMMPTMPN